MAAPVVVDIPHTLGREEAKRRMASRIGELASRIPGGASDVTSSWPSEYRMALDVTAMGQTAAMLLDIEDRIVRVTLTLPPMLSFMAGPISALVRRGGEEILLEDRSGASLSR